MNIFLGKARNFGGNQNSLKRKALLAILEGYKNFILKKFESNPIYRDRSPTNSLKDPISMDDEDVSSSNDVVIFDSSSQQPESTSLAILSGVVPLSPLKVLPETVLDEKARSQCLKELLNPHTFLSDITINAFSVS